MGRMGALKYWLPRHRIQEHMVGRTRYLGPGHSFLLPRQFILHYSHLHRPGLASKIHQE